MGTTWYPTATTDGLTQLQPLTCAIGETLWGCSVQYYRIDGVDGRTDNELVWRDMDNPRDTPTQGTGAPTEFTMEPTNYPSDEPSRAPSDTTGNPTNGPSMVTDAPTAVPTLY